MFLVRPILMGPTVRASVRECAWYVVCAWERAVNSVAGQVCARADCRLRSKARLVSAMPPSTLSACSQRFQTRQGLRTHCTEQEKPILCDMPQAKQSINHTSTYTCIGHTGNSV